MSDIMRAIEEQLDESLECLAINVGCFHVKRLKYCNAVTIATANADHVTNRVLRDAVMHVETEFINACDADDRGLWFEDNLDYVIRASFISRGVMVFMPSEQLRKRHGRVMAKSRLLYNLVSKLGTIESEVRLAEVYVRKQQRRCQNINDAPETAEGVAP